MEGAALFHGRRTPVTGPVLGWPGGGGTALGQQTHAQQQLRCYRFPYWRCDHRRSVTNAPTVRFVYLTMMPMQTGSGFARAIGGSSDAHQTTDSDHADVVHRGHGEPGQGARRERPSQGDSRDVVLLQTG